jgi:hypothetical protein
MMSPRPEIIPPSWYFEVLRGRCGNVVERWTSWHAGGYAGVRRRGCSKKKDKRCGCEDDGHGNDGSGSGTAEAWCQFGEDNNNSAWHAAWFSSFHQLTPRGTPSWTPRLQIEADLSRSRLPSLRRGLACGLPRLIGKRSPHTPPLAHMISPLLSVSLLSRHHR